MQTVLFQTLVAVVLVVTSLFAAASTHVLTVSPNPVNFGTEPVNTTTTQPVAVTNSGTGSVQIQNVTTSGSAAFQASGFTGTITLAPSQTLNLTVSFSPTAGNSYSGTLSITATGGTSKSVPLSGSGSSSGNASSTPSGGSTCSGGSTSYCDIDDSTTLNSGGSTVGWGWCGSSSCAGGSGTTTQQISWGQQPSLDGNGSVQFMVSGSAYGDGLWWYKVGPNDAVSNSNSISG